jgi:acyl carrier protein
MIQGLTSAVEGAPDPAGKSGAPDLRAALAAASESERPGILEAFVRSAVAHVLGVRNPSSIDAHKGLFQMGLDSLMSIDLKTRLANGVGHSLPSTLAFNYPSIAALTEFLAQDMLQAAGESFGGREAGIQGEVDRLSEEEVDRLLDEMLTEEERTHEH